MLEIIQGEKQPWSIDITSKKTGKPLDLTGYSDICVCFKANSTLVELKYSDAPSRVSVTGDPQLGQIAGYLSTTETETFAATTEPGIIEVSVDYGSGDVRKAQIQSAFKVLARACSS